MTFSGTASFRRQWTWMIQTTKPCPVLDGDGDAKRKERSDKGLCDANI